MDMGKYEPLTEFLRKQSENEIQLTFAQIERVIDAKLPPKAQKHRAWWSNSPANNMLTKAWLQAGFRSERVDMEGRKLVFRKIHSIRPTSGSTPTKRNGDAPKRHPLIGWMKGTVRIAPGVDLTEPADPEWGERAWGNEK
jgi:hypothetical protein